MTDAEPSVFPARRQCPFSAPDEYADWRSTDKPVRVRYANGTPLWAVTAYEDVKAVLYAHERTTANKLAHGFPQQRKGVIALSQDGNLEYLDEPEHGRLRRMMSPDFTARRIFANRSELQRIVDMVIDDLLKLNGEADLHQAFSLPVPSLVTCNLIGVPYDDHGYFEEVTGVMLSGNTTAEEFKTTLDGLVNYLREKVKAKVEAPSEEDLIGRLIIEHSKDLTYDDIVNLTLQLLVAGHETTANQLSMGVISLLTDADLKATMRANPDKWPRAVDELLRIHSITDAVTVRMATADMEVGGQLIKAGDGILPLVAGANHDPEVFPDPMKVKLDRSPGVHHMSFGIGIHSCIGQNLARTELELAYKTLFERVPTLRLAVPADELDYKHDGFVWGVRSLPVVW